MTTPVLALRELQASQSQPHVVLNAAIRALEVLAQLRVIDKDLAAPPASPAANARYIVASSPSGAWAGKAGSIAYYAETAWAFLTPESGWRVYVVDEDAFYVFDGSAWTLDASGGGGGASLLQALLDVDTSGASVGQVLTCLGGSPLSFNFQTPSSGGGGGGGGGANYLDDLSDVDTSGATAGQVLALQAGSPTVWRPTTVPGLGNLAAEIAADNPVGYWKCDETSGTTLDNAGSGGATYDMTLAGTYTLAFSSLLPDDSTKHLYIASGTNRASVAGALGQSVPLTGDYTIEAVVMPLDSNSNTLRILTIMASGETEVTNAQASFLAVPASASLEILGLSAFWEYNAGTNETVLCGGSTQNAMGPIRGRPVHVAIVKNGTANTIDFFINGYRVDSRAYSNEPSGGSDSGMTTYIGADATSATGGMVVGHVAYFASALSADRIRAHARAAGFR